MQVQINIEIQATRWKVLSSIHNCFFMHEQVWIDGKQKLKKNVYGK